MTKTADQFVHESEVNRQFIRVSMPARVEMNGKEYPVKDLSSGGIGISDIPEDIKKGETLRLTLILPFADFSLDSYLEAQVQSYHKKDKILGARFINLSPPQISMLNHVIRAYVSGNVVSAGELLDVAGRHDFVRVRNQKNDPDLAENKINLKKNILPLTLIALAGIFALFILLQNIYHHSFFVTSSNGVVVSHTITLRAPVNGLYQNRLNSDIFTTMPAMPLADIIPFSTEEDSAVITGFCECYIMKHYVSDGEYITQGDPLFDLVPTTTEPKISIFMELSQSAKLQLNDRAIMEVVGTDIEITGQITDIKYKQKEINDDMAEIIVTPAQTLPIDLTGRPVITRFSVM